MRAVIKSRNTVQPAMDFAERVVEQMRMRGGGTPD